MKLDRLIGILSLLLQREKVTAPELAERFEVSRRTIQRDLEALSKAGIPLVTTQGAGGGISIMEGYRVNRTVLTAPEMQAILAGLRSLDSVSGTRRYNNESAPAKYAKVQGLGWGFEGESFPPQDLPQRRAAMQARAVENSDSLLRPCGMHHPRRQFRPYAGICQAASCGWHPMGQRDVHERKASGVRCCLLASFMAGAANLTAKTC